MDELYGDFEAMKSREQRVTAIVMGPDWDMDKVEKIRVILMERETGPVDSKGSVI